MTRRSDRLRSAAVDLAVLASVTLLPQLLGGRGRLSADTKQYLYLDPGDLLARARYLWDARVGGGTVTHQAVGYLWPMGPYYWAAEAAGLPDWAAQRLWIGGIQLAAALGTLALLRRLLPRHPGLLVGAALYGLSPVVLGHVTGQSALLLPYAALPWLVLLMLRAVEDGGWRWPAAFALVVTSCGSLNGSSVFFALLAAVLWVPFAVGALQVASPRQGLVALARAGGLTVATQLWWLVAYAVGGAHNLPILDLTENVQTTSYTTSAAEVVRGLGYWFFYGADSQDAWLSDLAVPYVESIALILVSFAVPVAALVLGAFVRWPPRAYFAVLVGLGTIIAVGAFPEPTMSPLGSVFEWASRRSGLVLSLRNTQRAAPLVVLGLAGLAAAGLTALSRRHLRGGAAAAVGVAVLVAGALPGQWRSGLIASRFHRQEALPAYWEEAMAHLDHGTGRILELPGIDFASYRWGHTLDPVSVGLTDRPVLTRELVPMGGLPGVSLLGALDRGIQEGWIEPAALAPVARLLGASDILVRNDLEYERYRTARPAAFWDIVRDPDAALGQPATFGPGEPNRAHPSRPMIDEIELGLDPTSHPPPELAVFPVPGGGRSALSTLSASRPLVVDGDGEGVVNAAAAALLDGSGRPVLLAADLLRPGGRLEELSGDDPLIVLTDTNRKRATRWYSLRENTGATEPLEHTVAGDDPSDTRTPLVAGQPAEAQTSVEWRGAERVWASRYGSGATLLPEERPALAFDGDPSTAWRVDTFALRGPHVVGIELTTSSQADHVVLVAPRGRPGTRPVTRARVILDGERTVEVDMTPEEATAASGVEVELDGLPFTTLEVEVLDVHPDLGPAGFAEIQIPGVSVDEVVVLPSALTRALGSRLARLPTSIVLTRLRANPAEPVRADAETALRRAWTLPVPIDARLTGSVRLSSKGPEEVLDRLLGIAPTARSSERLAGDLHGRAAAILDGDVATRWSTPLVGVVGQHVEVDLPAGTTVTELELDVVVDERHSVPTEILVSAGDGPGMPVSLPPLHASGDLGDVETVQVGLPRPLTGDVLRVMIAAAAERTTPDWYSGAASTLPVALAELRVPGTALPSVEPVQVIDTGCRDDLVTIDGEAVGVRITGPSAAALDHEALDLATCDGAPIPLTAGAHDLAVAPGSRTGLDLDRLVLQTPSWAPGEPAAGPSVDVSSISPVRVEGTISEQAGHPFWVVLDQSVNEGWDLDIDGAVVDGPRPMGSFAAAWYVEPERAGSLSLVVRFTPQQAIDWALVASALAVAACLILIVAPALRRPRRGTTSAATPYPATLGALQARPSWLAAGVIAVVAALAVHPLAAAPALGAAALARRWPLAARLLPAALVAAAAANVAALQLVRDHELASRWPSLFPWAHVLALLGAVLVAGLALAERDDR